MSPQGTVHIQDTIKFTKVIYVKFLEPDSNRNSRDITSYYYSLSNNSLRTELRTLIQFSVACLGSSPVNLVFDTFNFEMYPSPVTILLKKKKVDIKSTIRAITLDGNGTHL